MIQIERLSKAFGSGAKRVEAVKGIDLTARPGRVFGLLGPNGAGKTTTLRAIATLLKPDSGTIRVAGHDVVAEPDAVRSRLGFLTGATALYDRLNPVETLQYFGRLQGMDEERIARRTAELAELLEMKDFLHQRVGKCSTGQKQKCSIARAALHDPEVIVLDEPTSGLDVIASASVVGFIRRCAEEGRTVLFSTHILPEAERLCHDLAFIHQGRIVEAGTMEAIVSRHGTRDLNDIFLRVTGHAEEPERPRRRLGDHFLSQARQRLDRIPWPDQNPAHLARDMALLLLETMREFFQRGAVARAAALTYTTLLSLIPLIGLVVVVFKQVGGFPWLMEKLQPLLAEYLSLDGSQLVGDFLLARAAELDLATLGLFGVITLGMGVYSLISTIETDFNNIWRVRRSRSIRQRLSSYWLLMTLLPVFAGVSMFLSGEAAVARIFDVLPAWVNQARGHLLPVGVQFCGFLFLYWAVPNTRVKLMPAAIGAAFTAVAWEGAKLGFAFYTMRASSYSMLYGSLAALPLFMVWVYLTWVLILTGAELSFIIQNRRALLLKRAYKRMGPLPEYTIALAVREAVLAHFEAGRDLSVGDLSRLLCLPEAEINAVVEVLVEGGLFRRSQDGEKLLVMPARPREHLDAATVAGLFLKDPAEFVELVESPFLRETLEDLAARHGEMLKAFSRTRIRHEEE